MAGGRSATAAFYDRAERAALGPPLGGSPVLPPFDLKAYLPQERDGYADELRRLCIEDAEAVLRSGPPGPRLPEPSRGASAPCAVR